MLYCEYPIRIHQGSKKTLALARREASHWYSERSFYETNEETDTPIRSSISD
jgi:hypothetical protein